MKYLKGWYLKKLEKILKSSDRSIFTDIGSLLSLFMLKSCLWESIAYYLAKTLKDASGPCIIASTITAFFQTWFLISFFRITIFILQSAVLAWTVVIQLNVLLLWSLVFLNENFLFLLLGFYFLWRPLIILLFSLRNNCKLLKSWPFIF